MSSYVEKNLTKGEEIIYKSEISLWPYSVWILIGLVMLPMAGSGIIILLLVWGSYSSQEVVITNKRVVSKSGFISRRTIEMNLKKVESLQVHQSIFDRMFGFGSIVLSGAGNPLEKTPAIKNPMNFRKVFLETQEELMDAPSINT